LKKTDDTASGAPERSLTARMLAAQDEERRKISRELHDSVGQSLAAVKMGLSRLKRKLGPRELKELEDAEKLIDEVLTEVRTVSHLLHPPSLDLMGLRSSLVWYAEGFQKRAGIQTDIEIPESLPTLPEHAEIVLFRLVQECLTNVHRHAQASRVIVRVAVQSSGLRLEVTDNGKGFAPLDRSRRGVGILGMQERLKELNGVLHIESRPGKGSSVLATIPLEENKPLADPPEANSRPRPARASRAAHA
jgi:two-component system, NarL family, sensor kinase